jgi:methylenetetrahydrofolate dehydrogenase (NADP+)/methenyltetrahydrofolate cyclohydrolase
MTLTDDKKAADKLLENIVAETKKMFKETGRTPHLAVVLVGDNPTSHAYFAEIEKTCKDIGFFHSTYRYPETINEKELLAVIEFLNIDEEIDGFIVPLPLPDHLNKSKIIEMINPSKDVDVLHGTAPIQVSAESMRIADILQNTLKAAIKEIYK